MAPRHGLGVPELVFKQSLVLGLFSLFLENRPKATSRLSRVDDPRCLGGTVIMNHSKAA
jgi:hypothetical protein